jgi:NTE family protein
MTTVGLVLGAGGAVGRAFHVGALAALEDAAGWDAREAQVVVGTSAGSIVAAVLRAGVGARDYCAWTAGEPVADEAVGLLRRFGGRALPPTARQAPRRWRPAAPELLLRAAARPWRFGLGALAAAALPEGAVRLDGLADGLESMFGRWPDRPLWVCAVSLDSGARVVFGRGDAPPATVADAVSASCAIPGWFAPVRIGGARYVDGGAHSLANLDAVAALGLDVVVVSSPMSAAPAAWSASVDGALRSAAHLQLRRERARLHASGTRVVVLEPDAEDLRVMGRVSDAMDPSRRPAVARQVRGSMRERLRGSPAIELLRDLARRGRAGG